jgi:DNA polymerase-3 subunit epsilon
MSNKIEVAKIAYKWLEANPIYLDTETTGLGGQDQICQIAIIGDDGKALLETLVKPTIPIPLDATRIHGITQAMVAGAPAWKDIWQRVAGILKDRTVVVYNANYDITLMHQSSRAFGVDDYYWPFNVETFKCAMLAYAEFYGEWNEYRGGWKWQRLEQACQQQGIPTQDIIAHQAAGDCEMTRRLLHKMAEGVEVMA